MNENELRTVVHEYLEAFDQRDLERCMSFFADDALIHFGPGTYRGNKEIEEWHKSRFAADLRVTKIDKISIENGSVVVDAVATSNVARAWNFPSITGKVTLEVEKGKIKTANFALTSDIPLESW